MKVTLSCRNGIHSRLAFSAFRFLWTADLVTDGTSSHIAALPPLVSAPLCELVIMTVLFVRSSFYVLREAITFVWKRVRTTCLSKATELNSSPYSPHRGKLATDFYPYSGCDVEARCSTSRLLHPIFWTKHHLTDDSNRWHVDVCHFTGVVL